MENNLTQVFVVAAVVSPGMKGKVLSLIVAKGDLLPG